MTTEKVDEDRVASGKHFLKVESGDDRLSGPVRLGAKKAAPSGQLGAFAECQLSTHWGTERGLGTVQIHHVLLGLSATLQLVISRLFIEMSTILGIASERFVSW